MDKDMIEWEKFRKLESKYSKLSQKQVMMDNKFKRFEKMPQAVINLRTSEGLYLLRTHSGRSGIIYLKSTKIRKNHCDCCGKKRKTTAHHIIPKRVRSTNIELANIRIRVCNGCEQKIHPENGYDESIILRRKEKQVRLLQDKLNLKNRPLIKMVRGICKERLLQLRNNRRQDVEDLVKDKKFSQIPFTLNRNTGRLKEVVYLKKLINEEMSKYFKSIKHDASSVQEASHE